MGPGPYPPNQGPYPPQNYPPAGGPQQQQPYPPVPGPYPPNPGFPAPIPPPRKKPVGVRILGGVLGVIVVIVIAVVSWVSHKSSPDAAVVGDCVSRTGSDDIKVVKCTDPKAEYKVVGKVEHKTRIDFSMNTEQICRPFAGSKSAFWKGKTAGEGYILCLGSK